MSVATLREGDAWPYLRFKQELQESSHQALFENGNVLPVLMRGYETGKPEIYVETEDYRFVDPTKLKGFIRLEETAEEKAWQAEEARKAAAAGAAGPRNLTEAKLLAEQQARHARMQHRDRSVEAGAPAASTGWINSFAEAARRERNAKFTSH